MRIFSSTIWALSAALVSSAAAQDTSFIFDGASFSSPSNFGTGNVSVFRYDDISEEKTFILKRYGGRVNVTRIDLMDEGGPTLASLCLDKSCNSTAGLSRSSSILVTH